MIKNAFRVCICILVLVSCAHSCESANENYREAQEYATKTDSLKKRQYNTEH